MRWGISSALYVAIFAVTMLGLLARHANAAAVLRPQNPALDPASSSNHSTTGLTSPLTCDSPANKCPTKSGIAPPEDTPTTPRTSTKAALVPNGNPPGSSEPTMASSPFASRLGHSLVSMLLPRRGRETVTLAATLNKRDPFDDNQPQIAPPSQWLVPDNLVRENNQDIYTAADGTRLYVHTLAGTTQPQSLDALSVAVARLWQMGGGITTTTQSGQFIAYQEYDVTITVRFILPPGEAIGITNRVLADYINLARSYIEHRHDSAEVTGNIRIQQGPLYITITPHATPDYGDDTTFGGPPPPYTPNATGTYVLPALDFGNEMSELLAWFAPSAGAAGVCSAPSAQRKRSEDDVPLSLGPAPRRAHPAKAPTRRSGGRKCKAGKGKKAPNPKVHVPRRANESVWIDSDTGWQAVQISHAASVLGFNVSQAIDYVSLTPHNSTAKWADLIASGGCQSSADDEDAIAGLLFGCDTPSPEERRYARLVLLGEDPNMADVDKKPAVQKRDCAGTININNGHAVSSDQVRQALRHLELNGLQRLPDDFNSIKIQDTFFSWSYNSRGCGFLLLKGCGSRWNNGAPPSFEEVSPFYREFLNKANWAPWYTLGLFERSRSVVWHDTYLGKIKQGVCISNRAKGCKNANEKDF